MKRGSARRFILSKKGFTLVELIIVIGIMVLLTMGLLIAIDPVEQIARGRDANRRKAVTEYYSALYRYYAGRNSFPWGSGANILPLEDAGLLGAMLNSGELSYKYSDQMGQSPYVGLTVTTQSIAGGAKMWVCFNPESKSMSREALVKYLSPGNGICDPQTSNDCYYCAE